ncbi:MAG: GLPGLI family protein [Nonlabens sp.]|jgi:GLPGLI family protein
MKRSILSALVFTFTLFISATLSAQENSSGQVTYEQITAYDFGEFQSDPRWEAWLKDQPKQGKYSYLLSFSSNAAFYEKDPADNAQMSEKLQSALKKANWNKAPKAETKEIYYDFDKGEQTEQIEFMTRSFQVTSEMTSQAWKLTSKKKKVLDYICIGAEMTRDDVLYTAWFTSEIPISGGPAGYSGLPGLVLAVEKNEAVFILATKVDLSIQPGNLKAKLKDGKMMSRKMFDQTVAEKVAEFKESLKNKSSDGVVKKLGKKGE